MYRSVVVPLDGSTFGEHALPHALMLARRTGARIELLHVLSSVASMYAEGPLFLDARLLDQVRDRHTEEIRAYLSGVADRLTQAGLKEVTTTILEGDIATEIRKHADKNRPDLIVMTTHGRGAVARFWLGSVADDLVSKSPCPMLLVHPHDKPVDLATEPSLRHFLVPLDGEPLAEQMLAPAAALAKLANAKITLLRVMRPVFPAAYPPLGGTMGEMAAAMVDQIQSIQGELRKTATDYLEKKASEMRAQGLTVATRIDMNEQPANAILRDAAGDGIDLIAIGTHGRRGLGRMLVGSVADKVIRAAPVPVMVQHPAQ